MVGRACGEGIRPRVLRTEMTSVGSQDTTGPMTRDELKDPPVWDSPPIWSAQSFCHNRSLSEPVDVTTHHTLPDPSL